MKIFKKYSCVTALFEFLLLPKDFSFVAYKFYTQHY